MKNRVEYSDLRTIDDVRRERLRLRVDIERHRHRLERDRDRLETYFSAEYWLNLLSARAAGIVESVTGGLASRIRGFSSGLGTFGGVLSGLLGRFHSSRSAARRRKPRRFEYEEEEDYYYDPKTGDIYVIEEERIR